MEGSVFPVRACESIGVTEGRKTAAEGSSDLHDFKAPRGLQIVRADDGVADAVDEVGTQRRATEDSPDANRESDGQVVLPADRLGGSEASW